MGAAIGAIFANTVLPIALSCLKLGMAIAEIVKDKGIDDAGNMKLSDIPFWKEWSADLLSKTADQYFVDELKKLKEKRNG